MAKIESLCDAYHTAISVADRKILEKPIEVLAQDVRKGLFEPLDILRCYGKVAVSAQRKTNCLTEILLPEAEDWAKSEACLKGEGYVMPETTSV